MFIAVYLDNYNTLPYTIIFVLPSLIVRASINGCSLRIINNTLTGKTLEEKLFGTGNSLKNNLTLFSVKYVSSEVFESNRESNKYS